MKTLNLSFAILLISAMLFVGCESGRFCMGPTGEVVTQTISLETITGIDLCIAGNVTLHQDSIQQIKITGHQNIIDNIELSVVNGIWKIKFDECVRKTGTLEIEIWLPTLEAVTLSGSGNITGVDEFIGSDDLDIVLAGSGNISLQADAPEVSATLTGSGDIDLETDATNVSATITGSGEIEMAGTCVDERLEIAGSGNIKAFEMLTTTADVIITGSGNCELTASEHINVTITGSGDVRYKGDASVDSQITGSGSVKHEN